MPIRLDPLPRRRFLQAMITAPAIAAGLRAEAVPQVQQDPNRVALLADTHVSKDPTKFVPGTRWPGSTVPDDQHVMTNMADNLDRVVAELIALNPRPACVMVNGDCAYSNGRPEEYREFIRLIKPLREQAVPVHVTMGNHDHRENFWAAAEFVRKRRMDVEGLHIDRIETPYANLFLIDSLPGHLGDSQIQWLETELQKHQDKPALVAGHHNPWSRGNPRYLSGLSDGKSFVELLNRQRHVKAYLFGHTHDWHVEQRGGLHCVNLPPVGPIFGIGRPNGWVDLTLRENGAKLVLRCIDPKHPDHEQTVDLKWR